MEHRRAQEACQKVPNDRYLFHCPSFLSLNCDLLSLHPFIVFLPHPLSIFFIGCSVWLLMPYWPPLPCDLWPLPCDLLARSSSAVASSQFSAAGSTPSHKETHLPGILLLFLVLSIFFSFRDWRLISFLSSLKRVSWKLEEAGISLESQFYPPFDMPVHQKWPHKLVLVHLCACALTLSS